MTDASGRAHDLVLFGATGFVGRLVAAHLAAAAPEGARLALAGRSPERLRRTRDGLGPGAADWDLLAADAGDPKAMRDLAAGTHVVATTVGPYARYGLPLVEACAAAGTHYADLTGEVLFVRDCIDRFDGPAAASGARIVHACGFDSIPSDLGVHLVHARADADGAGALADVTLVARLKGGFSGGTVDSGRAQMEALEADPTLARVVADPYALSPDRSSEPDPGDGPDPTRPARVGGAWTAPFVMGPFNTRIVRRSNALLGWAYGRSFRYREAMATGAGPVGALAAGAVSAATAATFAAMAWGPTRAGLDRVLPRPGRGPSEKTMAAGWFRMDIHATTTGGARYLGVVAGDGDPGYAATAVMFGQSALCLAFDEGLPDRAGVLTPATAMGTVLTDRLRAAGIRSHVDAVTR